MAIQGIFPTPIYSLYGDKVLRPWGNVAKIYWVYPTMKNKKPLWIVLFIVDVAITAGFFVIHIMMLINLAKPEFERNQITGLFRILMDNNQIYLWGFVVPLFLLLALNIIGLVLYVRKTSKKEVTKLDDLTEDQKEALRQQLLERLGQESKAKQEPEPKEETKEE